MDVREYLRRHDVVFKSPMRHPSEALPVGNGDLAAMVWTTDDGLEMQINKSDLWTCPDEESPMMLRNAARVKVDFGVPCNDFLYLKDFDCRLSLADAEARFMTETPFVKLDTAVYAAQDSNVLVIETESEYDGELTVRLSAERYGSRSFPTWNGAIFDDPSVGLGLAKVGAEDKDVTVYEEFDSTGTLSCCVRARAVGIDSSIRRLNSKRAEAEVCADGKRHFYFLVSVVSSHDSDDPTGRAKELLDEAEKNVARLREEKNECWREYWNSSFVHHSERGREADFTYLENLYYVQQYIMGIGSKGRYLTCFNGGTFTWNRDVRQWGNPHHWNTQQAYWSVEASNHPELMMPYVDTYSRILPKAKEFAREAFGVEDGAVISEMHDFDGRMLSYFYALTPASQMAMQFWDHYTYNGDVDYLRETGFPFISACAEFYAEYAVFNEKTGKYDIGPAAPYETCPELHLTNTTVDGTMARYILKAALEAADVLGVSDEKTAKWKEVLDNLFEFNYVSFYKYGEGHPELLAFGLTSPDGEAVFAERGFARSAAPIAPCPIIGSRDRDTRLYKAVERGVDRMERHYVSISPKAAIEARLGRGKDAFETLFDTIDEVQHFPQGLLYNMDHWSHLSRYSHLNPPAGVKDLHAPYSQRDYIYDSRCKYGQVGKYTEDGPTGEAVNTPAHVFAQCGMEAAGCINLAYNELALQSYEDVIRIFPAYDEGYDSLFTLKAKGGFMVTGASTEKGVARFIIIKSLLGNRCTVEVPFDGFSVCGTDGTSIPFERDGYGAVVFETKKGETYLIASDELCDGEIPDINFEMYTNDSERNCRNGTLGCEKMF